MRTRRLPQADTESAEALSAKTYEDFMNEGKKDVAVSSSVSAE